MKRFHYVALATSLIWLPPVMGIAADVKGKPAVGWTLSDHPLLPFGCSLPPFMITNVSYKHHFTNRVGAQGEVGLSITDSKSKASGASSSNSLSTYGVGGRVLYNVIQAPYHNLYLNGGPVVFMTSSKDEDEETSGLLYGVRAGSGIEVFPPYAPQLGVSVDLGLSFITGSLETKQTTTTTASSSSKESTAPTTTTQKTKSDFMSLGTRGGFLGIGVHYYFGKAGKKDNSPTSKKPAGK